MSAQCQYFVQNAWKKELCSNCFKLREEHVEVVEIPRLSTGKAPLHLKTDSIKLQGILKGTTSSQRRKKVVFPESVAEIIGYGGDDFSDQEEFELSDPSGPEDDVPDSEEERTLCNLTRANTNFNTVTANLSGVATPEAKKSFASLMLGKPQKDADGRKKTLLVSVTPFGGDDIVPTAKRPNEKRAANFSSFSKGGGDVADDRSEVTLKSVRSTDERTLEDKSDKESRGDGAGSEKIVDMPLITSSNLISVIQRSDSLTSSETSANRTTESYQKSASVDNYLTKQASEKKTSIARTPAIKKTDSEKPRVSLQNAYKQCANTVGEYIVSKSKDNAFANVENGSLGCGATGIELTLSPLSKMSETEDEVSSRSAGNLEKSKGTVRGKDVNKITVTAETRDKLADRDVRKVEGEAAAEVTSSRKFSFEESRELAGEPDGEADEEMTEPPSLPRSPPPIDLRPATRNHLPAESEFPSPSEPRPSFLHGGEKKPKPAVPQKPTSLPPKPASLPKSPTSSIGPSFKKNGMNSHALPPPHVQNAASKSTHFDGTARNTHSDKIQSISDKSPFRITPGDQQAILSAQAYSSTVKSQSQSQSSTFASKTLHVSQSHSLATKTFYHGQSTAQAQTRTAHNRPEDEHAKAKAEDVHQSSPGGHEPGIARIPIKVPASPKTKPAPLHLSQAFRDDDGVEDGPISPEVEAELIRSPNKRRMAPKPPAAAGTMEEGPGSLFARNPGANLKSDSPVVREKEKRERASSCSPKFRKAISDSPDPSGTAQPPEPAPRRIISLSQDSLANADKLEEKKKGRSRFSLKKFLRMGSKKDVDMTAGGSLKIDEIPTTPQPKPRLEIIHPLELDGAAVEVLSGDRVARLSDDVTDSKAENFQPQHSQSMSNIPNAAARPGKPPPPPRNQSLDDWSRLDPAHKPARPPPPRTEMKLPPRSEKPPPKAWQPPTSPSASDSIYANLAAEDVAGEVRSALAPSKPQRTASMRDQAICQPPVKKRTTSQDEEYETLHALPHGADFPTSNDSNVYECLSSSPECDSNLELRHGNATLSSAKRKSDSSAMSPGNDFKYHHQPFTRSTSLPYCGSETESEHYAPYSFYTGDEGPEEDQDWKGKDHESKVSRLRQRRGRSIVHRSLEDNYGAVVVANHEALAQVLEQLNQIPPIPSALRSIKTASLRFSDFTLDRNTSTPIGKRIFYSATWKGHNVTVCVAFDLALHVSRKEFHLSPITEFTDLVPDDVLEKINQGERRDTEATISVLPRLHVSTLKSFGAVSKDANDEGILRESSFVMLQLVNALKSLQARGIEEAPKSLNSVVLCREDKNACYRLYLLQGLNMELSGDLEEERVSLCQCTLIALKELFLDNKLPLIKELLSREKAVTLSQVKSVLEFSLWGPADVTLGDPREREIALQRWLDLEKATVLHALVRARAPLSITDEYHLLFLVRTSAKIMCEASILLDAQRNGLRVNSNS